MEHSDAIVPKRSFFDRLLGKAGMPGVITANQVITVWGTQGGVGCTTITAVIAKMLHQWGFTVLVIEATQTGGSILRYMGKKPVQNGLDTISRSKERLKSELESVKVNIVKGFGVLPRSGVSYNAHWLWQEDEARELYQITKKQAAFVLVDAGHVMSDALARAALTESDQIIAVFRPTPVGLDSAVRFNEHCKYAKLNEKRVWVMNQAKNNGAKSELEYLVDEDVKHWFLWDKDMELLEHGGAVSRNIQEEAEGLLQQIVSAPSARVF